MPSSSASAFKATKSFLAAQSFDVSMPLACSNFFGSII